MSQNILSRTILSQNILPRTIATRIVEPRTIASRVTACTLLLASLLTSTVLTPSLAEARMQPRANGYNVVVVKHDSGEFVQIRPGVWKETLNGRSGIFREEGRDEWSVYLVKRNGVRVQLDLYRRKVILRSSSPARELYTIRRAGSVNGSNVTRVAHANGSFAVVGAGRWREVLDGRVGYFTEQARDAWSVYLVKDNGVMVQIDLYTNKISQRLPTGDRPLYTIQRAR